MILKSTPLTQRIINFFTLRNRFFVNDGIAILNSKLPYLSKISIDRGAEFFFGNNSSIQQFCVINIGRRLEIGNNVMIASNCFISDFQHSYLDEGRKLGKMMQDCTIGNGTFIGSNSTIISSKIGKNCVIGSNSVLINQNLEDGTHYIGDCRLEHRSFVRREHEKLAEEHPRIV